LALAAVLAPRLAFSGGGGHSAGPAAASLPLVGTTAVGAIPLPTVTTTAAPAEPTTTTVPATPPAVPTTIAPSGGTAPATTTSLPAAAGPELPSADGGAVDLVLVGVHDGRDGPPRSRFFDGERVGWHYRVTNVGDEYLWGVFVYLELYGRISCEQRRLEVGESADCWAETTAWAGRNDAEAWVTAWTAVRMVTDRQSHHILAIAR